MAYSPYNPYINGFNNYNTNYMPTPQTPLNGNSGQNSGILWVQGENGAKSYLVGAGQSVLLMDSEENKFYIKTADSSGMPMPLRIFSYTEATSPNKTLSENPNNYITREEFEAKIAEITAKKAKKGDEG